MNVDISLGDFHRIHAAASEAEEKMEGGLEKLSEEELRNIHTKLCAAQRLSNSKTGSDSVFAADYRDNINAVQEELYKRMPKK